MKHMVASLTIGACLLLSSAGVVFAANAHKETTGSGTGAPGIQNGTGGTGVASCGAGGAVGAMPTLTQGSPPGQVGNLNTNSPFPTSAAGPNSQPNYSGTGGLVGGGTGNYGAGTTGTPNPHANSQYDNACFQHQVP